MAAAFGPTESDLTVLSLGAGVQSTALLLMAVHGEFDRLPDVAIFADTGWEPKGVYAHLDWLEAEFGDTVPIRRVSAGSIREDVLGAVGSDKVGRVGQPPFYVREDNPDNPDDGGRLWRRCTREYKIEPINREIRHLLGVAKGGRVKHRVEQWFGISVDEIGRMKPARDRWINSRWPLIERRMTRLDCLAWLRQHGYPEPPKSACVGCPFHSSRVWREMRDNHPDEWADAVAFDKAIRRGIPGVTGEAYLHRSFVPLDEVDLSTPEDRGQLPLFDDECTGMCGV